MRLGRNVRRLLSQGMSGHAMHPDTSKTRGNAGSVRAVSAVRGFLKKSPGKISGDESDQLPGDSFFRQPLFYPDCPDSPDRDREYKGFSSQGIDLDPDRIDPCPDKAQPPWHDDREWIALWLKAGPKLADRLPVLRAWLAAAPPEPVPHRLAALELRRIAREHAIEVEVAPAVRKPDRHLERLLAAADRALSSPDALADEAEVMLRGEIDP